MSKYSVQANALNDALASRGMNRAELARRTGLSPAAITYYCNGDKIMSLINAEKIARALDISLEYLATGKTPDSFCMERKVNEEEYALVQAFRLWMRDSRAESGKPRHLFLRGAGGIGKSDEIRGAVIGHLDKVGGFYIQRVRDGDFTAGFALNPVRDDFEYVLSEDKNSDNSSRMFVIRQKGGWKFDGDVFEKYGVMFLRDSIRRGTALTVLDETGGLDLLCGGFRGMLYEALEATACIGAFKSAENADSFARKLPQAGDAKLVRDQYMNVLTTKYSTKFLDMTEDNIEKTRNKIKGFVKASIQRFSG